jgi:hypothetical protein
MIGLEHPDTDPRKFMKSAHSCGLLNNILPDVEFDPQDMPENFRGDRWLSTAWILRNNSQDSIKEILSSNGWSEQEANDIAFLVRLYDWGSKDFDPEDFYDVKSSHTGLTKSKLKDWMKMAGLDNDNFNKFMDYDASDLTPYISDSYGKKSLNPLFKDVMGRTPVGQEFDYIKKDLFKNKWKKMIGK